MSDHVVMISGASRGIGAETARAFAALGAKVALVARSRGAIEELAQELGPNALPLTCDISHFDQVEAAIAETRARFGQLNTIISNAGAIDPIGTIDSLSPEDWGHAIDVNLKGPFHLARAALPGMIAQGGGSFLHVSSGAAHAPRLGWSAYCASKAGAAMLVRAIHLEHGAQGIRAIGLSPGTVATDMQRRIKASGVNEISQMDWAQHVSPTWPAQALVWMASAAGDRHLGQELSLREAWFRKELGLQSDS